MSSPIPTQLSPGVNVSEIDLSQFVQPESLNSAGMVGTFNWGPASEAIRVTNESVLAETFGKPTLDQSDTLSEEDFFAAANFLKYSNNLKVVRILQADDVNSVSKDLGITGIASCTHRRISNLPEFALLGGFSGQNGIEAVAHFRGRYPGNFGDSLMVKVYDGGSGDDVEINTQTSTPGLVDYDIFGGYDLSNLIGITSGTIGFTFSIRGTPTIIDNGTELGGSELGGSDLPTAGGSIPGGAASSNQNSSTSVQTLGTTSGSVDFYLATILVSEPAKFLSTQLTNTSLFKLAFATGSTSSNLALTSSGDNPSGNRANYFVPKDFTSGQPFNPFSASPSTIRSVFAKVAVGSTSAVNLLFLDADSTNLASQFRVGLTFGNTSGVVFNITEYSNFQTSGIPSNFGNLIFTGTAGNSLFDLYRFNAANIPNKMFPGGIAPQNTVRGWAKLIAMTGGVTFADFVSGVTGTIGITFDSVGGVAGVRRDFAFGMRQFIRDGLITNTTTTLVEGGGEQVRIFDKSPQTSAYAQSVGGANDEISFAVIDTNGKFGARGAVIEKFELLSKAVDAKNLDGESIYYKDYINNNSKYVYMTKPLGYTLGGGNASSDATTSFGEIVQRYLADDGTTKTRVGYYESQLDFGQSGITNVTTTEYTNAYKLFADDDYAVDVLFVPESSVSSLAFSTANGVVEGIAYDTVIAQRKDTILVLPTPKPISVLQHSGDIATKTITFRNNLSVPSNSYTMLVAGRKTYFDTFNNQIRKMSLSSDLAGILCAQEIPWESPAGFARGNIRNVIKLETNFTKAERDELYKNGINFFVQFSDGSGTVLFGDKTLLTKPSAFDRINVRRVFISLEKAISKAAKYSLFEFNDEFTRSQFRNLVTPFLSNVQAQRGIADFKVVCDETNNTQEVIDKNQFVADIYIKPSKSVNFIQLNFVAVRSDFNLSTLE
jgi:hypothetical protein